MYQPREKHQQLVQSEIHNEYIWQPKVKRNIIYLVVVSKNSSEKCKLQKSLRLYYEVNQ